MPHVLSHGAAWLLATALCGATPALAADLGPPPASRADADILRWDITLREGPAWAGSVFRQGGFAVTSAAELYPTSWEGVLLTRVAVAGPAAYEDKLDVRAGQRVATAGHGARLVQTCIDSNSSGMG